MKNKIWLSLVASFLPIMANADCANNSEYCADGTDYSNAVVNTWVEDQSNEFTEMAASFACILRNTGTAVNANKTWEALISENICGLDDAAKASELSRAVMKSTRTSNTADQLGEFYFYGNGERNFVGNLIGKRGPDQFAPFGEWYVSYYLAQLEGSPLMTYATSPAKGLVDISEPSPGKVSIKTVDLYDTSAFGGSDYNMIARVEYADQTFASSQLLGRRWGTDRWEESGVAKSRTYDEVTAGRTNADYYFRVKFPYYNNVGGSAATVEAQCFNRKSLVKSTHEYGLYEKATGKKLSLTGGFGFTFNSGSNRGYFDRWGVWLDSGRLLPFNAKTPTLAVVNERTQENVTLNWAPGKLEKLQTATENLPKDTTKKTVFNYWTNSGPASLSIAWDGSKFVGSILNSSEALITDPFGWSALDTAGKILTADITEHPWLGWAYSEEKNTQIYWDGGDAIKYNVSTDVSSDATVVKPSTPSQYIKLVSRWGNPPNENLPVDAAAYQTAESSSDKELFSYIRDVSSEKGQASNVKYYFTTLTPPSGKLARTLYLDLGSEGPTSEDKAVMFDFNIDRSTGKYHPFDSTNGYGTAGDWKDSGNDWPYDQLELVDASDSSIRYRWNFEANPWGQSIVAVDSSGDMIELDQPMQFKYTHTASNDINQGVTNFTFIAKYNNYNPVRKLRRTDGSAACARIVGNTDFEQCTISAADLDGKDFLLDYDGNWIGGLPSVNALFSASDLSGNYWTRLVNPKDETVLTDTKSGKEYVIKALGVSSAYQAAPDSIYTSDCDAENDISFPGGVLTDGKYGSTSGKSCTCDGLAFNSVASFGWDITDLPDINDYPAISQTFSNVTALSQASECTVTMGDTSGC